MDDDSTLPDDLVADWPPYHMLSEVPSVEKGPYSHGVKQAVDKVLQASQVAEGHDGVATTAGRALEAAARAWQDGSEEEFRREQPHLKMLLNALDPNADPGDARDYFVRLYQPYEDLMGEHLEFMFERRSTPPRLTFDDLPPLPALRPASPLVTFAWTSPDKLGCPPLINPTDTGSATVVTVEQSSEFQKAIQYIASQDDRSQRDIVADVRRISLDRRLLPRTSGGPGYRNDIPWPHSKIEESVARLHQIWLETTNINDSGLDGVQVVLADTGYWNIHRNPETGFSFWEEFTHSLTQTGIPSSQIAGPVGTSHLPGLLDMVNHGSIRILIVSSSKALTGVNMQKQLVATHNLDSPSRADWLVRREGCILRQGNSLFEKKLIPGVMIFNYVVAGSWEIVMWKTLDKQKDALSGPLGLRDVKRL